jgi:hypothetical protein
MAKHISYTGNVQIDTILNQYGTVVSFARDIVQVEGTRLPRDGRNWFRLVNRLRASEAQMAADEQLEADELGLLNDLTVCAGALRAALNA